MIALCLSAFSLGAGSAGAADAGSGLFPTLPTGQTQTTADEPADIEGEEPEFTEEPESEDEADEELDDVAHGPIELRAGYAGSTNLVGLRKMSYLATCPEADCELSIDVELRFPGGRRVVLETTSVKLNAGDLQRISVRVSRFARRLMKRAARLDQKVLASATVFEWSAGDPVASDPIRTRLR